MQTADVEQLARGPVGHGRVPHDLSFVPHDLPDQLRQLLDGDVLPHAHVDEVLSVPARIEVFEQEDESIREVVHEEELPARCSGPPKLHRGTALRLGLGELADHGWQHVRRLQVEVVPGTVEVGGHGRDEVRAVLPVVGLRHQDAGDLRDGVGVVGGLEGPGEQVLFLHRLGSVLGIDAGAAEKQELLDAVPIGGVDDVRLDLKIDPDEVRRVRLVGVDAPHLRRGQDHVGRLRLGEEALRGHGVRQVQRGDIPAQHVAVATLVESSHDRRAHEPRVTRHEYALVLHLIRVHHEMGLLLRA